ncbi:MAG TPA: hypothetical protein VKX49_21110 [Bryobacteraceae bacterium]|nr:hypothetical protein [Bryobacteraceae bacterium]
MNRKIERLMQTLRDAIHDALGESAGVAAAMAELERAGHCPSLLVDVSLPAEKEAASIEPVRRDGPLFLTESDDDFLRNIGIGKLA